MYFNVNNFFLGGGVGGWGGGGGVVVVGNGGWNKIYTRSLKPTSYAWEC